MNELVDGLRFRVQRRWLRLLRRFGISTSGWPRLLVLVRHAESEGNLLTADERADLEVSTHAYALTPRGREQARLTGEFLRRHYRKPFDVRYCSYYARAKQTMELVLLPGESYYTDPRLAEAQRGVWHVAGCDRVKELLPTEVERKKRDGLYHYRPLGGENWADVELRIHSFLETLARDCTGKRVIVVVHGHWFILFQRLLEHFPIEEAEARYRAAVIDNASVTEYRGIWIRGQSRLFLTTDTVTPWKGKIV